MGEEPAGIGEDKQVRVGTTTECKLMRPFRGVVIVWGLLGIGNGEGVPMAPRGWKYRRSVL